MWVKSCEFCEICNFIKLVKVGVDQGLIKLERSVLKQLPRVSDFSIEFAFYKIQHSKQKDKRPKIWRGANFPSVTRGSFF